MAKRRQHIIAECYDKRGRLLSVGYNSYTKTHPIQAYFASKVGHYHRQFLHAEIAAILRAKGKSIHRIVVKRYSCSGLPANAAPCPICQEAIKAFGIKEVIYTNYPQVIHKNVENFFKIKKCRIYLTS